MEDNFEHTVPWEVILIVLEGKPDEEDRLILQDWLDQSIENHQYFDQVKRIWETDPELFSFYQSVNPQKSWDSLHQKIKEKESGLFSNSPITQAPFISNRTGKMVRWSALAALFLLLLGFSFWIYHKKAIEVFQTSVNQQLSIFLSDGTRIQLLPSSLLKVPYEFGKAHRRVSLIYGGAEFRVMHQALHPFTVLLGNTLVRDIGTTFIIMRGKDKIDLQVQSGKVVFIQKGTQVSRQLTTGMSISYHIADAHFGQIKVESVARNSSPSPLRFVSTPLKKVILVLNKNFRASLFIEDTSLGNQKLTANLEGDTSLDDLLKIIGTTMGIRFVPKNGGTLLEHQKEGN